MRTPSLTLLLFLALGLLFLAGCQAGDAGPDLAIAVAEPTAVASPTASPETDVQNRAAGGGTTESDMGESVSAAVDDAASEEKQAGNANVEFVRATREAGGTWRFDVTVRHPDTGWEDYADGWDVVTPDGQVLKVDEGDPFTRLLLHPHENEQPFTRSQGGIVVPEGVTIVTVRAHDLVDGFGGRQIEVDLTLDQGLGFEVRRQ